MASLKDQLINVKKLLKSSGANDSLGEKPGKVDFEPPPSWLATDGSKTEATERPMGRSQVASVPASVDRRHVHSPKGPISKAPEPIRHQVASSSAKSNDAGVKPTPPVEVTLVFRPRIDSGRSLNMPEWISLGRSLQHPKRQSQGAAAMRVRIGVDFGTAFTKVAIRAGRDVITVDWAAITGDESPISRFVMPGVVIRGLNGEYSWRRTSDSEPLGNLKLPIIEQAGTNNCPVATLAFLALVIRYARAFLYRHQEVGRKLETRSLRWELNIGCPTEPHEKPEVVYAFGRIARTAWKLAALDGCREVDITAAWESALDDDVGLEAKPRVVPEFVAQIAGYLRSPQVTEGLHALIDVGAATLDVATFNVVMPINGDSTPRIPIFYSTVCHLGTHFLSQYRHRKLQLELEWDDASPVEPVDEFAKRHGKLIRDVEIIDTEFVTQVMQRIAGVIDATRTSKRGVPIQRDQFGHYPKGSVWAEGFTIFVSGGGANCDVYRRATESALLELKRKIGSADRFRFIELDPLGGISHDFAPEVGTRLTVAIGLTEDADDIARIVPHREIEPISGAARERIDHSEIYGDA